MALKSYRERAEHFVGRRQPKSREEWLHLVQHAYRRGYAAGAGKYIARQLAVVSKLKSNGKRKAG